MSKSSQTSSISLLSGGYQGRFIDVSFGTEKSEGSSAENVYSILVLIEDRLFSLRIQEKIKLSKGALISFEVTEDHRVGIVFSGIDEEGKLMGFYLFLCVLCFLLLSSFFVFLSFV